MIREKMHDEINSTSGMIDGPGVIVRIDESKHGKCTGPSNVNKYQLYYY